MWISNARSHSFGEGPRAHELQEVPRRALVAGHAVHAPRRDQPRLHTLVQHEVHHGLADAHVRSRYALVEASYALQI